MSDAKRVLVIGDDPVVLGGLKEGLKPATGEIESCFGSCDALRRVRHRAFDVVVTNPLTHVGDDLALVAELRRARPGVRAIVLAPDVSPQELIEALRSHIFACFTAPFDMREVSDMVGQALRSPDWRDGVEVISGLPNWITLRVSCGLVTAERLVAYMNEWQSDRSEEERENLVMAFREMLLNAMEHGAGFDPDKVIEVTAARTDRAIVYHLKDPGPGFDRDGLGHAALSNTGDDPLRHLDERHELGLRAGGFGIMVARQMVDELVYIQRGNEVLLIKHTK
jgi:anti-sigma regulatory factor (Ser/Thr protein kinase)